MTISPVVCRVIRQNSVSLVLVTLIFSVALVAAATLGAQTLKAEEPFEPDRLEKQTVVSGCFDPMQMVVLSDQRILFIERHGAVKLVSQTTGRAPSVAIVGQIPVAVYGEVGLLGIALDPSFDQTGWVYLCFCPQARPETLRLSRFTIRDGQLAMDSEISMLTYGIDVEGAIHMGGGLWMDDQGHLWLGTGDNCPPIPELPMDFRVGQKNVDAFRTSANSQDLRGKVLRIHPQPDGSYSIPAGNLFSEEKQGRPEIYAMGCRNPFRLSVDPVSRAVLWGDVGPNIAESLALGPDGYDEFHRATEPGNFGWPMFVGPNEAYRHFDFATRKSGEFFNANQPINPSPNNTGLRHLPPPQPAVIWYPSISSTLFPTLGSGGRSAMSGPIYRFTPADPMGPHLHDRFQSRWFIFDWTRNWIQTVQLDNNGSVVEIEPFMPKMLFRKPIDIKVGRDGSLFVIEYGDKWGENRDAEISRIVYRRGNRAPVARVTASKLAGRAPLPIHLDASSSSDPDCDSLVFRWELNGKTLVSQHATLDITLKESGSHRVRLTAIDPKGMAASRDLLIHVGNEPPQVSIQTPQHGSFFDWGETIHYTVEVDDLEDGSIKRAEIAPARVVTSVDMLARRGRPDELLDPGLALMRKTTCFSCHTAKEASAGPSYEAVARKYNGADEESQRRLAAKIISGGTGVWGDKPMPPHPQHNMNEAALMVRWILSLSRDQTNTPRPGTVGFFQTEKPAGFDPSVLQIVAEYTDNGATSDEGPGQAVQGVEREQNITNQMPPIPALRGEDRIVLHARKKRAAFADRFHAAKTIDVFERGIGLVARLEPKGWLAIDDLRLEEIDCVSIGLRHESRYSGRLVLRKDTPDGIELASLELQANRPNATLPTSASKLPSPQTFDGAHRQVNLVLTPTTGMTNLYLVFESHQPKDATSSTAEVNELDISWIEFHDSTATQQAKKQAQDTRKRILLIPTKLDHAWATHMYTDVCRLLAATLNLTPGVEAIVSPDLDWPKDDSLLDQIDAIVYYSRPAGDILLSPRHRARAKELMDRGIGFTAIHWSTGAEKEIGPSYESILGGWFNFEFSGLTVDKLPLQQIDPNHPLCRGWEEYLLRDEFYLNLKFHPAAVPVLKVRVNDQDQTVAWVHHRDDGGRSFGTTLGHFHDNFADPRFRRLLVNGILWTTGFEVPEAGFPVEVPERWLQLDEPLVNSSPKEWTYERLRDALLKLQSRSSSPPSFEHGKQLFQQASCASCHLIHSERATLATGEHHDLERKLGPDLTRIRIKVAESTDPLGAILRSIVEPSETIDDLYRSEIVQLEDGTTLSGLVREEREGELLVAINPLEPNQLRAIPLDEIEGRRKSEISWMPAGLLNSMNETQVRDLLTYVEAGGDPNYFAYRPSTIPREAWADTRLPIASGLRLWLDASRIKAGRMALSMPEAMDGGTVGFWPDASGHQSHSVQRQAIAQPILRSTPQGEWIEFDGVDDHLVANFKEFRTNSFTASLVVAPNHNRGWPGLLSGNALGRDDFRTGFNLDLMHEPTETWRTIMSEGPGYQGVINLMNEDHAWGEFFIITLRSSPGVDGVVLRVNGRPQQTRDRPSEMIHIDELTIGARHWSHDINLPAFTRGFLSGRIAEVLFFERPLSDDELIANEVYLWSKHERLLDHSR